MRVQLHFIAFVCIGCVSISLAQAPEPDPTDQQRIEQLIQQLNDDRFTVRQEAEKKLLDMGPSAVAALRVVAASDDVALRKRSQRLLKKLMLNLTQVEVVSHNELKSVTSVAVSADGKYVYAAAFEASALCVFSRDEKTGRLTKIQTLRDPLRLRGVVSLRLSPNGKLAVASCFQSKAIALFRIDPDSGKLERTGIARTVGDEEQPMAFPIEAVFSNDSKFVYAVDPNFRHESGNGALLAFKVKDEHTLGWVETNVGVQVKLPAGQVSCFQGARGLAMHPDGKRMYVIAEGAWSLTALDRDSETGATKIIYTATDGQDGIRGLQGGFSVVCSPDGEFVYTSSGRFGGDNAIGVYRIEPNGSLRVVQEFLDGENDLEGFEGGNEIVVSADGQYVYAAGTRSCSVVGFKREANSDKLTLLRSELIAEADGSLGPAGLGLSPDGKHLYVASEAAGEILVYRLDPLENQPD